jgi:hypothetical protein
MNCHRWHLELQCEGKALDAVPAHPPTHYSIVRLFHSNKYHPLIFISLLNQYKSAAQLQQKGIPLPRLLISS